MATEITRFWCLLDVGEDARRAFMRAHLMLSAPMIQSCAKEIEHFVGLRTQKLPLLIREQDPRIDRLLSTLHVIWSRAEHDDLQATFDCNDEELKDLTEQQQKIPIA
jgi:hypothetical protein